MESLNKQKSQFSDLQKAKRQQLPAEQYLNLSENIVHAVNREGLFEDEGSDIEVSDVDNIFLDEADNTIKKCIKNI